MLLYLCCKYVYRLHYFYGAEYILLLEYIRHMYVCSGIYTEYVCIYLSVNIPCIYIYVYKINIHIHIHVCACYGDSTPPTYIHVHTYIGV